jgi:hypothetical protein
MEKAKVNKDLVIEFLNMMLEDADIVDVDFIPTGHQKLTKRNSKAIFTFRCQCRDGESIIIKMQIASNLINEWRHLPREDYFKVPSSEWDISRKEWE